jgi:NAD+ synthase
MLTLYYHAAINNFLVVGTGNKVEDFGIGFYTKYGDGGVDISPIADLMKSEVKDIGKEMGINNEIITADPTDGLWDDTRTDEVQIGATYNELEWAMNELKKEKKVSDFNGREREVFQILLNFNSSNKHKMIPIPICEIPNDLRV